MRTLAIAVTVLATAKPFPVTSYPPERTVRGGAHCVHRECALAVPSAMALLKGQMSDYCAACLRDMQQAREHWRTGKEFPVVLRLPQPDASAAVESLKPDASLPASRTRATLGWSMRASA